MAIRALSVSSGRGGGFLLLAQAKAVQAVALRVLDDFVVPRYRALAEAAAMQEQVWTAFRAERDAGRMQTLRDAYHAVCDAWASVQLVKTGPIGLFLRYERFAYWPEARNATGRALDALLAAHDPAALQPEALAGNAVAGQGLTALERILYDGDNPDAALKAEGDDAAWRAAVGEGIARNLHAIAQAVLNEWTAADGVRAAVAADMPWRDIFADGAEAASLLLTDLVAAFRTMNDVKILPVLGESVDTARPRMAEAWRSARSKRNLVLNLAAAQAMAASFGAGIGAQQRARLEAAFAAAGDKAEALPDDFGDAAADPARRPSLEDARASIRAVQTTAAEVLPAELGIALGFNSLDGD